MAVFGLFWAPFRPETPKKLSEIVENVCFDVFQTYLTLLQSFIRFYSKGRPVEKRKRRLGARKRRRLCSLSQHQARRGFPGGSETSSRKRRHPVQKRRDEILSHEQIYTNGTKKGKASVQNF